MRTVSARWGSLNAAARRERRYVFRVIPNPGTNGDDYYIVSHDDIVITDVGTVLQSTLVRSALTSQTLHLNDGRSTIGSFSFDAVDIAKSLTNKQRSDLQANHGLRGKRVEFYSGFPELSWDEYELEGTQIVQSVSYHETVYTFQCQDIQRELRTDIFEPVVLRLAQPLDEESTTIEVFSTAGLEAVEHGTSYSDGSSGETVAYVQIDDEIIKVPSSGILATQLTNCDRGALGTRPAEHSTNENSEQRRGKEISEVIYLELPVPKLVYALLTGVLIEQAGTLPDHWHLGIDAGEFVRLSDFTGIGSDFYDQDDDTAGIIERHIITSSEDGKRFIEHQILRKYGWFLPIGVDGRLGLKRVPSIQAGAAVVAEITDENLTAVPRLKYEMELVINDLTIAWNEIAGTPTRNLRVEDPGSIAAHGRSKPKTIEALGWVGNRHTESLVLRLIEGYLDLYAGPPISTSVRLLGSQCLLEVGDVVRVRTAHARDVTNEVTTDLDRAFLIIGQRKDLQRGEVTLQLLGSTRATAAQIPLEAQDALGDAFYTAAGTDIASLPGVTDTGAELTLPNALDLSGAADLSAIYYASKDVSIPAGNTVTFNDNVQLRIRGNFTIEGEFDGAGRGLAGIADTVDVSGIPIHDAILGPVNFATQAGVPAYFGTTQADGGIIERVSQRSGSSSKYRVQIQSLPATITQGQVEAIPALNPKVTSGTAITGLPTDLRGTSGGPGGLRHWDDDAPSPTVETNRGGTGGAGGAGALIICRGMTMGVAGRVITSGADGIVGVINGSNEQPAWSGGGAGGAPGAVIILLDGATANSPVLTDSNIVADYGATPKPGSTFNKLTSAFIQIKESRFGPPHVNKAFVPSNRFSFYESATSGRKAGIAAARFFFLRPDIAATEDLDEEELAQSQTIAITVTEAFSAVDDTKVTQIIVDVTEVSTTAAYAFAAIYTKRTTGDDPDPAFVFQGGAQPRLRFTLPADGENYIIRARAVLNNGVEAPGSIEETKIVSQPGLGVGNSTIALKLNARSDGSPDSGEFVLSGTNSQGDADFTKDGFIIWNGAVVIVPRDPGPGSTTGTGLANIKGLIAFDTALSDPFNVASVPRNVALVYKDFPTGQWKYDDNSQTPVNFSPTSAMIALGWIQTGTADSIVAGGLFGAPVTLTLASFPAATEGAHAGIDLKNEGGSILADIDIENDFLVEQHLGGSVIKNGSFHVAIKDNDGNLKPNLWFRRVFSGVLGDGIHYENNSIRRELQIDSVNASHTVMLTSEAFRVNPGTRYEIVFKGRQISGSSDLGMNVYTKTTDLVDGKVSLLNAVGGVLDSEIDTNGVGSNSRQISLTGTDAVYTQEFAPSASEKWASIAFFTTASNQVFALDYVFLRDKSTRNTGYPDLGGLIFNSDMRLKDFERNAPLGWYGSGISAVLEVCSYQDSDETVLLLGHPGDNSLFVQSTAFQLDTKLKYTLRVRLRGNIASASGLFIRVVEYDNNLPEGKISIATQASDSLQAALLVEKTREVFLGAEDVAVPGAYTEYTLSYTPTSAARWASVQIANWTGHGFNELWIKRVTVEPVGGAQAGFNLLDNAGSILTDPDVITALGTSANTNNVGTQTATVVQNASINFNNRNDRISAAVVNPTVAVDGTAIDHTANTDGSVDISFEWTWSGLEEEIDGFAVYLRINSSSASYVMGTSPAEETVIVLTPEKRAFLVFGVPANKYYTFGVQAFRIVDLDVNGTGFIKSNIVQPSLSAENPYRPSAGVAFAGDLTGTINGQAAGNLANADFVDFTNEVVGAGKPGSPGIPNHMPFGYADFETAEEDDFLGDGGFSGDDGVTIDIDPTLAYLGEHSLKLRPFVRLFDHDNAVHFFHTFGDGESNLRVRPNRRWLVIASLYAHNAKSLTIGFTPFLVDKDSGLIGGSLVGVSSPAQFVQSINTWQQCRWELDLTAESATKLVLAFGMFCPANGPQPEINMDAVMLFDVTDFPQFTKSTEFE